jgi:hypothetical protein
MTDRLKASITMDSNPEGINQYTGAGMSAGHITKGGKVVSHMGLRDKARVASEKAEIATERANSMKTSGANQRAANAHSKAYGAHQKAREHAPDKASIRMHDRASAKHMTAYHNHMDKLRRGLEMRAKQSAYNAGGGVLGAEAYSMTKHGK